MFLMHIYLCVLLMHESSLTTSSCSDLPLHCILKLTLLVPSALTVCTPCHIPSFYLRERGFLAYALKPPSLPVQPCWNPTWLKDPFQCRTMISFCWLIGLDGDEIYSPILYVPVFCDTEDWSQGLVTGHIFSNPLLYYFAAGSCPGWPWICDHPVSAS